MGVNVGVGVLGLAVFGQDTRGDVVYLADELEHGIVWEMGECEFTLRHVAGVGLAEDCVAVAGDDLAGFEGRPEVVFDALVAEVAADGFLHLLEPVEDFLVGAGT